MPSAVYIWDLPLRLFHWLLVITLLTSYVTAKLGGLWLEWHSHAGVFGLSLIVFRLLWGLVGNQYARFAEFFPTPGRLRRFFTGDWRRPGHTPLAALSVFTMLAIIFIQAGSGLFALNDESEFFGPLYELIETDWTARLTRWHTQWVNVLLVFIGLHVLAIAYYTWVKHQNLIGPMLMGKCALGDEIIETPRAGGGVGYFLLSAGIAGLIFWSIESGMLLQWLL